MVVFKMLAVLKNSLPSGQRIKENKNYFYGKILLWKWDMEQPVKTTKMVA